MYYFGIDIGGTKTAILLANGDGETVATSIQQSESTDAERFFSELCEALDALLHNEHIEREAVRGIGIGMPGIVDRQQGMAVYQNNLPLAHFPMKARLLQLFPQADIQIDNDVNVAALHEYKARHFSTQLMLYITVSTGIASTLVHAHAALNGQGMAGEIGFSTLGYGRQLEQDVSGPALERKLQQRLLDEQSLPQLLVQARPEVEMELAYVVERLGQLITEYTYLLHPHCIVIGGGVMNAQHELIERIEQYVAQQFHHLPLYKQQLPTIEGAIHKGDTGVKGALMLLL